MMFYMDDICARMLITILFAIGKVESNLNGEVK